MSDRDTLMEEMAAASHPRQRGNGMAAQYQDKWDDLKKQLETLDERKNYAERIADIARKKHDPRSEGLTTREAIDDLDNRMSNALRSPNGQISWPMAVNGSYWIVKFMTGLTSFAATMKDEIDRRRKLASIKEVINEKVGSYKPKDFNKVFSEALSFSGPDAGKTKDVFSRSLAANPVEIQRNAVNGVIDINDPDVVFSSLTAPQANSDFSIHGGAAKALSDAEKSCAKEFRDKYQFPTMKAILAAGADPAMEHEGRGLLATLMSQPRMGDGKNDHQFAGMMLSLIEKGAPVNNRSGNDSPLTLARTPYEMNILFSAGAADQTFFNRDTVAMRMIRHAEVEIANASDPVFKVARAEMLGSCLQALHKQGFDLDQVNISGVTAKKMFFDLTGTDLVLGKVDPIKRGLYEFAPSNGDNRVLPEEMLKGMGNISDPTMMFLAASDLNPRGFAQEAVAQAALVSTSVAQASRFKSIDSLDVMDAIRFFREFPEGKNLSQSEQVSANKKMEILATIGALGGDINAYKPEVDHAADSVLKNGLKNLLAAANTGNIEKVFMEGRAFNSAIQKTTLTEGMGNEPKEFLEHRSAVMVTDYYRAERFGFEEYMGKFEDIKNNPMMAYWHPDTPVSGDPDGNNLMMIALKNDNPDAVKFLLSLPREFQCDLNARNLKGETVGQLMMESYGRTGDEYITSLIIGDRDNKTAPADQPLLHRLGDNRMNLVIPTSIGLGLAEHYRLSAIESLQENVSLSVHGREAAFEKINSNYQSLVDNYGFSSGQDVAVEELVAAAREPAVQAAKVIETPDMKDIILFGSNNVDNDVRKKVVDFLVDSYYEKYAMSKSPKEAKEAMSDILGHVDSVSMARFVNELKDMVAEGTEKNPTPVDARSAFALYQILDAKRQAEGQLDPRSEAKIFGMNPDNLDAGSPYFSAMGALSPLTAPISARKGLDQEEKDMLNMMYVDSGKVFGDITKRVSDEYRAKLAAEIAIFNAGNATNASTGGGPSQSR